MYYNINSVNRDEVGNNEDAIFKDISLPYDGNPIDILNIIKNEGDSEMNINNTLSTIQKREKLNIIRFTDEEGPGGAHHKYTIYKNRAITEAQDKLLEIQFQKGARKEENSLHGVIDSDLLEIVKDRLKAFQAGPYSSRENACALTHIEEALMWMNMRVENRIERNVLGREQK